MNLVPSEYISASLPPELTRWERDVVPLLHNSYDTDRIKMHLFVVDKYKWKSKGLCCLQFGDTNLYK
jgi:hypothetical protein